MRKIASLLTVLMLICALAFGQTRTVTGSVKNDKGETIPAATVAEEGTKNAVKADVNGYFSIKIKETSNITITAAGYDAKTITPVSGAQNVVLTPNGQMTEVVVTTAIGIKRRPKEMGYATTTLKSDQITVGKAPNVGAALSGKIAGLTVYNTSNGVNSTPRIVLRGNRFISSGDNQALIVLDGVPVPPNTIGYLNPNDIESVTTLKGGQAATLYGSDGVNGVLVINTKKGAGKPTINVSHSSNFEQVSFWPKFNTTFGSGSDYGGSTPEENYRPFENQQYGGRYDGQVRAVGRVLEDGSVLQVPYQYDPKNRKDFFETGYTMQNDVSMSGGDANSSYYLSVQDLNTRGVVRHDEYHRDALRFNASRTYGRFKAAFDGTFTVDHVNRTNADFYFYALNTPGWVPIGKLKDWKTNKFANPNGYFNDYYNNPWFELDNRRTSGRNNYFNGNLSLSFKPVTWLDINYRIGTAVTNSSSKAWIGSFAFSQWAKSQAYTFDPQYNDYFGIFRARNDILGSVGDAAGWGSRLNSDLLITLSKDFGDFSGKLILGNNLQMRQSNNINVSSTSVIIPEIFNVGNRSGELGGGQSNTVLHKGGNYADLTVGYKDYIFVHGSFRLDQSSVFFDGVRKFKYYSYPYYGGDVSVILTEAIPSLKSDVLNYLKVRGGWNNNGNDPLQPYDLKLTYGNGGGFPYGSTVGTTVNNSLTDPYIKPDFTKSTEVGFEAAFWKNRINVDASYYIQNAHSQVIPIQISNATGYSNVTLNVADVDNKGAEVEVRANVLKKKDWSIDLNANYTWNTNKVTQLAAGLTRVQLNSNGSNAFIFAEIGQPFPLLKTTQWQRDPASGKIIVDANDGWPLIDPNQKIQGRTSPEHQLGVGARVSWKNFTLAANAEYRGGYMYYPDQAEDMAFSGSGAATTIYDRQQFIFPNSVYWDGTKYVPNTNISVDNHIAIYAGWGDYGFSRGILFNGDFFATSGAFWKVRDASLTYTFPQSVLRHLKVVKSASLSAFGRNLFIFLPKDNWYTDPEFSNTNGNGVGISTTLNTPPVRQFGGTLNLSF